ncbi:hypothetical protein [Neomegalonema sp.]|uniref:hypothetical protein n=1 Tax=Neomegalonema sp. TaxID=2039713 RepID=UPI002639F601|nr:hypothetical protein [Neomegalonema sp.]MDD2867819.1 hypothetical protein [Neomegalonema sp.]
MKATYASWVIGRSLARAGRTPQLKGHIQEILFKDQRNLRDLLNGCSTRLTRNPRAPTVDLVTQDAFGRVVKRFQIKDVVSRSGIDKLVRQSAQGKYRSARLVGSPETTRLFNAAAGKARISKRMISSGVSSNRTASLARRAGVGGASLTGAMMQAAKRGGAFGAVLGGGVALCKGGLDLMRGKATAREVAASVARSGLQGGVGGATSTAAAVAVGSTAAALASVVGLTGTTAVACTVAIPLAVAVGVGYVASTACGKIWDSMFA